MRLPSYPVAIATTALAAVVVALVLIVNGSGSYTVHAHFTDASQLVKGNTVEVGGRRVGLVEDITLTPDGLARVTMALEDESVKPLRAGTRAAVRTVGLAGVANRFVDLRPGPPTTSPIPDGGVLPTTATRGIVDLDAVFNAIDPDVRRDIQGIVRDLAVAIDATTARQANAGLEMLDPAMSQVAALGEQLTRDQVALRSLLTHTASLAGALSEHREALAESIDRGAGVFATLAGERAAIARMLARAPAAMAATQATLRRVRTRTLPVLDPVLARARPAIGPLAEVLRETGPTLENADPLVRRMRELVPEARRALRPLPELARAGVPAVESIRRGLEDALPMVSGLRPYTPELVAGFFSGFGGNSAHSYDANGHYARIYLEGSQNSFNGLLQPPPGGSAAGLRTRLDARCPGAAHGAHPDGSNPWPEGANAKGRNGCRPEDGQ